jgi:hypothetical protein
MKKDSTTHTSQDYDRKHQKDHISSNPRAAKDLLSEEDSGNDNGENGGIIGTHDETAGLFAKGHAITNKPSSNTTFTEDKRDTARHEHTNHFTNRAGREKK